MRSEKSGQDLGIGETKYLSKAGEVKKKRNSAVGGERSSTADVSMDPADEVDVHWKGYDRSVTRQTTSYPAWAGTGSPSLAQH